MQQVVVSFLTKDKPGIVDAMSAIVKQHQANWQLSSLHHIAGVFAGVVDIQVAKENTKALINDLSALEDMKLQWQVAEQQNNELVPELVLELTANDRVGIVQDITSVIHQQGGNLTQLVSRQENAAHSGQMLFKAKAKITVHEKNQAELISALEHIADDLMVDISK